MPIEEIKFIVKNFTTKKIPDPNIFNRQFYQILRHIIPPLSKLLYNARITDTKNQTRHYNTFLYTSNDQNIFQKNPQYYIKNMN